MWTWVAEPDKHWEKSKEKEKALRVKKIFERADQVAQEKKGSLVCSKLQE